MKKSILSIALVATTSFNFLSAQSANQASHFSFDDSDLLATQDALVNNASLGSLNTTTNANYTASNYIFYNDATTSNFSKSNSYPMSFSFDVTSGSVLGVWIDYNQNNKFEVSEKINSSPKTSSESQGIKTIITTITLPDPAIQENKKLRAGIVKDDDTYDLMDYFGN
jgi:hypothetical protein